MTSVRQSQVTQLSFSLKVGGYLISVLVPHLPVVTTVFFCLDLEVE